MRQDRRYHSVMTFRVILPKAIKLMRKVGGGQRFNLPDNDVSEFHLVDASDSQQFSFLYMCIHDLSSKANFEIGGIC